MLGAAYHHWRRGRRFWRLSTSAGPWTWRREGPATAIAEVTLAAPQSRTVTGRADLDASPLSLSLSIPLLPSSQKPPTTAWLDDLRARVTTTAIDVAVTKDALDVVLPLEGTAIDWRSLGALVAALEALGPAGRAGLSSPGPTLTRECPACRVPMRVRAGPHLEDECPRCRGTFFEGGIAATVLQERFGLTPADVLAAADATGAGGACPACARALRPVLLDDVIGDVCAGCGAVWLDAGERETLLP